MRSANAGALPSGLPSISAPSGNKAWRSLFLGIGSRRRAAQRSSSR